MDRDAMKGRAVETGVRPDGRTEADPGQLWNVAGVAAYLQLPIGSIYKMTAKKAAVRIPHVRIGGKLRFRRSDIDQWLTLLTVSNLDLLNKVRRRALPERHGYTSSTEAP